MDLLPLSNSPLFPVLILLALILIGYLTYTSVLELILACRSLARHLQTMFGFLFGSTKQPDIEVPIRRKRRPETDARFVVPTTAPSPGFYPGIVNMSGTFCFLNSVLQALSSLTPLLEHLNALSDLAIRTDTPTPLLSTFLPVLFQLLTPSPTKYPRPLRPTELVEALRQSDTVKRSGMFGRLRDQQDAQELWVLLNGCVEEERNLIEKDDKSSKLGLKGLLGIGGIGDSEQEPQDGLGQSPFEGRMAFRRSCQLCGYSEGIRLTKFDSLSLPVPRARSATLESMLEAYTSLEILTDSQCRKCRVLHTLRRLRARLPENELGLEQTRTKSTSTPTSTNSFIPLEDILRSSVVMNDQGEGEEGKDGNRPMTNSRKKRLREARKELERERELIKQIETLVSENRWEDNLDGVAWDLVDGGISTRQDMLSHPPRILTLHLNRSSFDYHYASKNACQVIYPSNLDLTPFSTTGTLSLSPSSPISSCTSPLHPTGLLAGSHSYELSSAVYHYGSHTSGHYVTYRRVPFTDRWLRISDDDVAELPSGVADVRRAAGEAFMLFYELRGEKSDKKEQAEKPELKVQRGGRSSVCSFSVVSDRERSPTTNGHVVVGDKNSNVTLSTDRLSGKPPEPKQQEGEGDDDQEHDRGSDGQDRANSTLTDDRKKKRKKKKIKEGL